MGDEEDDSWPTNEVLKEYGKKLDLYIFTYDAEHLGWRRVEFVKGCVFDAGRGYEVMVDGKYRQKYSPRSISAPGFVGGFKGLRNEMEFLGDTASSNNSAIAIINHPDCAELMELASFSIVMCTLPRSYDKHPQVVIEADVPVLKVLDFLCSLAESGTAGVEAGSTGE